MGVGFFQISINFIKLSVIFFSMVVSVPLLVWVERRVSALMQNRLGPNRVGPLGLAQILADLIKPLMKENFSGKEVNKIIFYLAPIAALVPPALVFGSLPFSTPIYIEAFNFFGTTLGPYQFYMQSFNLNIGIVFALGISSLSAYALLMAGWSSGNKYSLLGGLRAAAQTISYELALGLSLVGILLLFNTFDFLEIIKAQNQALQFGFFGRNVNISFLPNWGIFYQPLGALILFITFLAESNRIPFDLPEAEGELVAGYHTEYGGIKLILFYIGEYAHIMVASALMVILYFGGYSAYPFFTEEGLTSSLSFFHPNATALLTAFIFLLVFLFKLVFFLFLFIWIRWSLPRFRYDQLMDLGWKSLLPLALINAIGTGVLILLAQGDLFG